MTDIRGLVALTLFRLIAPKELWEEMADFIDFKLDCERGKHKAMLTAYKEGK